MTTEPAPMPVGQFRPFDHLKRLGHSDVSEIDYGTIHVFPKIDGTNASVWAARGEDGEYVVQCGSRTRTLSAGKDNAGFHAWVNGDSDQAVALRLLVLAQPNVVVYGEWLVPHTLKTYRDDAWRRFWIFDVFAWGEDEATSGYLPYDDYSPGMKEMGLDVIPPMATMENPSEAQVNNALVANTFLIQDGGGAGEGVVLKNYAWRNRHGRQPWAKIVRNEFKASNAEVFGIPHVRGEKQVESEIVVNMLSTDFIKKEWAKVILATWNDVRTSEDVDYCDMDDVERTTFILDNRHKIIPRFLGTFWLTFVDEEMRDVVKRHKNPVIDFGKLQKLATIKAKKVLADFF